jgi:hypothetical protein
MIYRTVLCLWLALFLDTGGISGQVYTDRKVREFKVTEKTSVEVSNKYGKIHVITWDKDSVKFEANLRISASNYQKMVKLKDNINFEFTATKSFVVAKTVFTSQSTIISDFVDAFIPTNQVSINYMVYVPDNISLKIENKFGDIYMDDFNGSLELILSNGDLKANKLTGAPVLRLSSGDGTINGISDGKVYVSYSDLQIKNAGKAYLETRSSVITIDQGNDLTIDSRRDKFILGRINELSATGYFSVYTIDYLGSDLGCALKYGNISVQQINNAFSFINIDSDYSDIDLYFARNTSYILDISHHYDVMINLPANLAKIETTVQNKEEKIMNTYGKIGTTATETSHKVKINAPDKCTINIIHR